MNKFFLIPLLCSLVLLGACSKKIISSSSLKAKNKLKTSEVEVEEVNFEYFESKTKIQYKEENQKVNGNATIRMKKDSIIWLSLSPSIGIEVTRSIITPDTIIVMNRMDKEYYTFNFDQLSDYFNFQIDFNLIQSILLANLPFELSQVDNVSQIPGYTKLEQKTGLVSIDSYINKDMKKLETLIMKELYSQNQLSLKYSNFEQLQTTLFPRMCMVNLTYDSPNGPIVTSVDIEHSRVELVDKPLRFPFSVPEKYVHK